MLVHVGQPDVAQSVHNAWLATIEDGVHTYDIHKDGISRQKVGTREFAEAVVARLGKLPQKLKAVGYGAARPADAAASSRPAPARPKQETVGVDVYVGWASQDSDTLAARVQPLAGPQFELRMLTSRGIKVWPGGQPETLRVDECRCRFIGAGGRRVAPADIVALLSRIAGAGLDFVKTENLSEFDGERGYSLGQGE
ncbi:MAG TPA: NADP-dependent isocitrate dehydrogenase, partial [Thermoanaerobaculia bacterium]|nr:NADP-dependent isocitrate dehydrogenase [Thermoanaerobaculia bacterium]